MRPADHLRESALAERIDQLKHLFPEAVVDGRIDWDRLRAALGEGVDEQPERFALTWAGKRAAMRLLQAPTRATLVPVLDESIRFDTARHVFIEGENLEVLKLLVGPYAGRVKMIYVDPPYNTGNDFVYPDDFTDPLDTYLKLTGQKDDAGRLLTTNPETGGRYHSAWLSMMFPRLALARQLLRDDGALCVSIGDREVANLRLLLNEVFGEENYRNTILVRRYDKNLNRQFIPRGLATLNVGAEYVLVYARSTLFTFNPVYRQPSERRRVRGYWKGFWNAADRPTMRYELLGVTPLTGQWKWTREVALEAVGNYQEYLSRYAASISLEQYWERTGRSKKFIRRNPEGKGKNHGVEHWIPPSTGILRSSNWTDLLASETLSDLMLDFDSPKSVGLLKELIRMCCDEHGLVLDFFAGSCTTAQAVLELNREDGGSRSFTMVQMPEPTGNPHFPTIAEIGKERLRRVIAAMDRPAEGSSLPETSEVNPAPGFRVFRLVDSTLEPEPGGVGQYLGAGTPP